MLHLLITRFNLKHSKFNYAKDGSKVNTDKWLEQRIELFKKYCLPSVINQKNKNFHWLIFFDIDTPEKYRLENELKSKNFHPIYLNQYQDLIPAIRSFINKYNINENEFIITSRLDNDDSIHKNFIGTIQKLAKEDKQVIDLRSGFQLDISNEVSEFREYTQIFNHFISFVEKPPNIQTVLSKMHEDWKQNNIVTISNERLWVEVIHDKNLVNRAKLLPLKSRINIKDFGLSNIPMQRQKLYFVKLKIRNKIKLLKNLILKITPL